MRKIFITSTIIFSIALTFIFINKEKEAVSSDNSAVEQPDKYQYPEFYKGIYLNYWSGKTFSKLKNFTLMAKKSNINSFVIDVQPAKNGIVNIPKENIDYLLKNGIHPIARIVCFQDGLDFFPVKKGYLEKRISIAKSACELGFKEIQFDYIRFYDKSLMKKLTLEQKYAFIEGFLEKARKELKPYNIKTAADIFGRIPLNNNDIIGQRMEGLDKVVDIICPMAYPSHYTWSKKMQKDPYYTVHITGKRAKERTKQSEIVNWIQAFEIKVKSSGLSYSQYIKEQIKACHDANIKGFLFWNARQIYTIPLKATREYYQKENENLTKKVEKNTPQG